VSKVDTVAGAALKWLTTQRMPGADAISRALNYSRVREISRRVLKAPRRPHRDFPNKSGLREVAHRLLCTAVTGIDTPSGG